MIVLPSMKRCLQRHSMTKPAQACWTEAKDGGASIRRSNPRGRQGWNGNVHSLRVWSHMREIRESRQQIRFSHRLAFNFAGLGCRSPQAGRFQSTLRGGCDRCPLPSWETHSQPNSRAFLVSRSVSNRRPSTQIALWGLPPRFFWGNQKKENKW